MTAVFFYKPTTDTALLRQSAKAAVRGSSTAAYQTTQAVSPAIAKAAVFAAAGTALVVGTVIAGGFILNTLMGKTYSDYIRRNRRN